MVGPFSGDRYWGPSRYSTSACAVGLLLLCLVGLSACALVYYQHRARCLFMQEEHCREYANRLHAEWTQLLLEQSTWASDERIAKLARHEWGMGPADPSRMVLFHAQPPIKNPECIHSTPEVTPQTVFKEVGG